MDFGRSPTRNRLWRAEQRTNAQRNVIACLDWLCHPVSLEDPHEQVERSREVEKVLTRSVVCKMKDCGGKYLIGTERNGSGSRRLGLQTVTVVLRSQGSTCQRVSGGHRQTVKIAVSVIDWRARRRDKEPDDFFSIGDICGLFCQRAPADMKGEFVLLSHLILLPLNFFLGRVSAACFGQIPSDSPIQ